MDGSYKTLRVIRLYRDDAQPVPVWLRLDDDTDPLHHWFKFSPDGPTFPTPTEIGHVIIHDLCKGAVNEDVVNFLASRYRDALYYVRTKHSDPKWLETIPSGRLALIVVGPERAAAVHPIGKWLIGTHPVLRTKQVIDEIEGRCRDVVLITEQGDVVARLSDQCVTAISNARAEGIGKVGWSSAVFAALVETCLHTPLALPVERIDYSMHQAAKACRARVGGTHPALEKDDLRATLTERPWAEVSLQWTQAMSGCGVILYDQPRPLRDDSRIVGTLDVWRAQTDLPGYVACIDEKRQVLRRICHKLRDFARAEANPRPLSIKIIADPGSGKTALAQALADAFDFTMISADITQMVSRNDLIDLFDSVAAAQVKNSKPLLVFIDELNAQLAGDYAYAAFLSPLEGEKYTRRGFSVPLRPCVWIFAETQEPGDEQGAGPNRPTRIDFDSRMILIESIDIAQLYRLRREPRELKRIKQQARLEQIYVAALTLRKYHSQIRWLTLGVLKYFRDFDPRECGPRVIRNKAIHLRNVRGEIITTANLPKRESWERGQPDPADEEYSMSDKELVELVSTVPSAQTI